MAFAPKRRPGSTASNTGLNDRKRRRGSVASEGPSTPAASFVRAPHRARRRPRTRDSAFSVFEPGNSLCPTPNSSPGPETQPLAAQSHALVAPPFLHPHPFSTLLRLCDHHKSDHRDEAESSDVCLGCQALLEQTSSHCDPVGLLSSWDDLGPPELDNEALSVPHFDDLVDPTETEVPVPTPEEQNAKDEHLLAERRRSDKAQDAEAAKIQRMHGAGIGGSAEDPSQQGGLFRTILLQRDRQLSQLRSKLSKIAGNLRETKRHLQSLRDALGLHIASYRDAKERLADESHVIGESFAELRENWVAWISGIVQGIHDAREIESELRQIGDANQERRQVQQRTRGLLENLAVEKNREKDLVRQLEDDVQLGQRTFDRATAALTRAIGELIHGIRGLEDQERSLAAQIAEHRTGSTRTHLLLKEAVSNNRSKSDALALLEATCADLAKQRNALEPERIEKQKDRAELETQVSALEKRLHDEIQTAEGQKQALQNDQSEARTTIRDLASQTLSIDADLSKLTQELDSLRRKIDRLRFDPGISENRVVEARLARDKDLVHHQGLQFALQEGISTAQGQTDSCQPSSIELKNQTRSLKANVDVMEKEARALNSELQGVKGATMEASSVARKQVDGLLDAKKKITEDVEVNWKRKESEATKIRTAASELLKNRTGELDSARQLESEKTEGLRRLHVSTKETHEQTQRDVEDLVAEISAISGSCGLLKEALAKLREELSLLTRGFEDSVQEHGNLTAEGAKLVAEETELERKTEQLLASTVNNTNNLEILKSENAKKENDLFEQMKERTRVLQESEARNAGLLSQLTAAAKDASQAEAEFTAAKQQADETSKEIHRSTEEKTKLSFGLQESKLDLMGLRDRYLGLSDILLALHPANGRKNAQSGATLFDECVGEATEALGEASWFLDRAEIQ